MKSAGIRTFFVYPYCVNMPFALYVQADTLKDRHELTVSCYINSIPLSYYVFLCCLHSVYIGYALYAAQIYKVIQLKWIHDSSRKTAPALLRKFALTNLRPLIFFHITSYPNTPVPARTDQHLHIPVPADETELNDQRIRFCHLGDPICDIAENQNPI